MLWKRYKRANLKELFRRIKEKGLTLAAKKCKFEQSDIQFIGHTFSENGISPSKDKIEALLNMQAHRNQSDVRCILGMVNLWGQRFKNSAPVTNILRLPTKKETSWQLFMWNRFQHFN